MCNLNNTQQSNKNEREFFFRISLKILNFIENNPIKIITLFIMSIGLLYLGIYYFNNQFFPKLTTENFIQLSFIFFSISFIVSIFLTITMFMPAEHYHILVSENKQLDEKIFSGLILFIILVVTCLYFYWTYILFKYNQYKSVFFSIIIFIAIIFFNIAYFLSRTRQQTKKILILIITIFVSFNILLAPILANSISKVFHLGNYNAYLIINNNKICNSIKDINSTCKIKAYILWNLGENYLVEVNNIRYKIPKELVLMEEIIKNHKHKEKK